MSVAATEAYTFAGKDARENFPVPLMYVGWEDHLMFCAPLCLALPPDTLFGSLSATVLPGVYGYHPDFVGIDWSKVEWFKSGKPWKPDPAKSLVDNGLTHKDVIRFRTPGLSGLDGSCN